MGFCGPRGEWGGEVDQAYDGTSTNPQSGTAVASAISGKADLCVPASSGNIATLSATGNLVDSTTSVSDFATATQGGKADTAVQSVKIGSSSGAELKSGTDVVIPSASTSDAGAVILQDTIGDTETSTTTAATPHAVRTAINTAVASAYHHAGTSTVAGLTSSLLIADNEGNVYNITDTGTTDGNFIEGAGLPIHEGDNVGICDIGNGVYKFDLLAGLVDLSNYVQKSPNAGLLKNDGTVDTNSYLQGVKAYGASGPITPDASGVATIPAATTTTYGLVTYTVVEVEE